MKRIFLGVLLLCLQLCAHACTVCGCSASNQYLGILPQYHKHFIGLQYQYRGFNSHHLPDGTNEPSATSEEHYSTIQAWGRFNAGKKVQLFAFVPYVYNLKNEEDVRSAISGVGDITLLANYRLIQRDAAGSAWKHSLQAGGGIKLPTGACDVQSVRYEDGLPNMQPGTNSWDFIVNANYTVRKKVIGANADVSYTITTPNSVQYKYGNRLSAGVLGFYWYEKNKLTLLPQAGLRLDVSGTDYDQYRYRIKNDMSGGEQLYVSAGIQGYYGRTGLQLIYHHPLMQHYASGLVKTAFKAEAGIYFLF